MQIPSTRKGTGKTCPSFIPEAMNTDKSSYIEKLTHSSLKSGHSPNSLSWLPIACRMKSESHKTFKRLIQDFNLSLSGSSAQVCSSFMHEALHL